MQSPCVRFILFLVILITCSSYQVFADSAGNISDPGVIINSSSILTGDLIESLSVSDILPLLNNSGSVRVSMPASVAIIRVQPDQAFSPNSLRPGAEVLYLLAGSAEVSADDATVNATEGDGILVPAGSVMMVKNTGAVPLTFLSVLSASNATSSEQKLMKRSPGSKPSVTFGNVSDSNYFSVNRMFSTFEESLPISFDLAIATLPAGNSVRDHYMMSGQLGYILSGTGTTTIGCESHQIAKGDISYIPPYAVQRIDASDEMRILLVTEPFYQPDQDFPSPGLCKNGSFSFQK